MKVLPQVLSLQEENVTKFREIYKRNPLSARIYSLSEKVTQTEVLLFYEEEHKFQLITVEKNFGVGVTNKIYCRPKRTRKIFVNHGKFYFQSQFDRSVKHLFHYTLQSTEKKIFYEHYPWLRFLEEHNLNIPFNTIFKYKLFSLRKALTYHYKVPYPICKLINQQITKSDGKAHKMWKEMLKQMININNFNVKLLDDFNLLRDSASMAMKLNVKINAAWSVQRLKNEHNEWSRKITEILYEEINKPLNILPVYHQLNETIGGLILDTKTLAFEGMRQSHCVATYAWSVDNGNCAIYHIQGYTAEIRLQSYNKNIYLSQFKGRLNCSAPSELREEVENKIKLFAEQNGYTANKNQYHGEVEADMPVAEARGI